MTDLIPNPVALNAGLDLSTAKLLVEPGSMLDCLNYEVVDELGYRRIDGFSRYDGNITFNDLSGFMVYETFIYDYTGGSSTFSDEIIYDSAGVPVGFALEFDANPFDDNVYIRYISFTGEARLGGEIPSKSQSWEASQIWDDPTPSPITEDNLNALQSIILSFTDTELPGVAVGLHWFRDVLYAVVPVWALHYEASDVNVPVEFVTGGTLTTSAGAGTAVLLDKIVTVEADASTQEEGYILISSDSSIDFLNNPATLGGAVTVSSGTVDKTNHSVNYNSDYCTVWKAIRPAAYTESGEPTTPGWEQQPYTYSVQITLSGVLSELNAVRRGNSVADSTYYVDDGTGTLEVVLLDYFIESGTLADGDAVITLQFGTPVLDSGTHSIDITTADDFYADSAASTKLGDVTVRSGGNFLPGVPSLKENSSRYEFISANFYADEGMDAVYGVNGAARAFVIDGATSLVSFIYTQVDADKDKPRHVENHALHLALGFKEGSVQLSIAGSPTIFDGDLGASEHGVGDRVTGLMALPGSTLGIFCEQSIWSLVGSSVDAFDKQVISPKTGCIEYTLVNCGEPVFCNNTGISTLSTSANYGDFLGTKVSKKVSSWLIKRLRRGNIHTMNRGGIACAIPVREKNQYRLFFNDGEILTLTLRPEDGPAFTFQRYYLDMTDGTETGNRLIPLASTSQVDWMGKERIFVSHFNEDSPVFTTTVFAVDNGDSFDGKYIPHYFDINWYFGQNPSTYMTLQGVRAFGLSRGLANLNIYAAGPQTDFFFKGNTFSTSTVPLNLPRNNPIGIVADLQPVTNRADINARGLALQIRIAGSNTDYSLIEPTHVVQVLTLYTTPAGAADL